MGAGRVKAAEAIVGAVSDPEPRRFVEGGAFEADAGYSRAVRHGPLIAVSGTTAGQAGADTAAQTEQALRRVIAAVEHLGGTREQITRTRLYLVPAADWPAAAEVHRRVLGDVAPANTTLFVHALVGEEMLVEVEAEAWVPAVAGPQG